jgi:hypothetical protein
LPALGVRNPWLDGWAIFQIIFLWFSWHCGRFNSYLFFWKTIKIISITCKWLRQGDQFGAL